MRFLPAGSLLAAFSLLSCTKRDSGAALTADLSKPPFEVQGVTGITFAQTPFNLSRYASQGWQVSYNRGKPRRVALSLVGLPAGLQSSLTVPAGYPNFSTELTVANSGTRAGNYTAELLALADGDTEPQRYPVPVTITGAASCPDYFAGFTITTNAPCFTGRYRDYAITLSRPDPASDTLLMHNFLGDGRALKVVFECSNNPRLVSVTQNFDDTTYRVEGQVAFAIPVTPSRPTSIRCTFYRKPKNGPPMECYPTLLLEPK